MVSQIRSLAPKAPESLFGLTLKFKSPENEKRHQTMLIAVRQYMHKSSYLFSEPGLYPCASNGVCLQGKQRSALTGKPICGQVY